jgi:hypothetical protein
MTGYDFHCPCVDWPHPNVAPLLDMVDRATDITRRTFLKHVNRDEVRAIERLLGYADHPGRGLTMAGDHHVTYHRSVLRGRRVYYFRHSAIEYIFTEEARV